MNRKQIRVDPKQIASDLIALKKSFEAYKKRTQLQFFIIALVLVLNFCFYLNL